MAAITAAAYLAFAGLVVGLLLWQTNRVLTSQVLTTLHAEAELLEAEAQSGDRAALVRAVDARSRPGGPGLFYLADAVRHEAGRQPEPPAAGNRRQRRGRRVPLCARRAGAMSSTSPSPCRWMSAPARS